MITKHIYLLVVLLLLSGCSIGPDYSRPKVAMPNKYKEAPVGWKYAEPKDNVDRGEWWKIFKDDELNALMAKVNVSNQNIAVAVAQFKEAVATLAQTRSAYWPTAGLDLNYNRQKQPEDPLNSSFPSTIYNTYTVEPLTLSWSPDIFGVVRRAVEASRAGAQASAAQLADTRLSMQALLAQTYFQLRAADLTQKFLDDTVLAYEESLQFTKNQYKVGVASRLAIAQADSQLQTAKTNALDNNITRGQYEHSIAVLIGQTPESFALEAKPLALVIPEIPLDVPTILLERRPDIAQAERLMAQANANIGVAIAAYFPVLTLTGALGAQSNHYRNLFSSPTRLWSYAADLLETIFDGGSRSAKVDLARATYEQNLASYKQTILTALQDVEDNLISLRILNSEVQTQNAAVAAAELSSKITNNQYRAGIVQYSDVIIAQNTAYTAKVTAINVYSRRLVASVGLIQALGGGWQDQQISAATTECNGGAKSVQSIK